MHYKKSTFLLILLFGIVGSLYVVQAQQRSDSLLLQRLDSLKQLPHADSSLYTTYYQLSLLNLRRDSAKAAQYAQQAIHLADSLENHLGMGIGKMALGAHNVIQGDFMDGLKHSFEAEQIFKQLNRGDYLSALYSYIGIGYNRLGNNNEALRYYLLSDSLMKIHGSPMEQAQVKANIGIIHSSQGHHEQTIEYFKEARTIISKQGSPGHIAMMDHNIGVAYRHLNQHDSALVYLEKAMEQRRRINDKHGLASTYQNLGKVYIDQQQYEFALNYIETALQIQEEIGDQVNISATQLYAARIFYNLNDYDQAEYYGQRSLETSSNTGRLDHQAEALQFLSKVEEAQSNPGAALNYLRRYTNLQDSLNQQNQVEAFEEMRARYQTTEMEQKIELLNKEQKIKEADLARAKLFRNSLIGGSTALLIILMLLYTRFRASKKHERELQEKNKRLEELSEEKSEYLHIAAHDLKTPLSGILGFSELIKDPDCPPEEIREHARFIHISAYRMLDLIKQFLDVNAIESGKKMAEVEPINLYPELKQVLEHYEYRAKWKNISLIEELHSECLPAIADSSIFQEVMENVLSNAVKYSPKGSRVWIRSEQCTEFLRIAVIDEGPGLSEDEQKQLFQKFKRLSPDPTEGEGSTGLGLYIVKKMMDAMNGKVWCESTPGEGSTFYIELPLAEGVEA
ncbi:tetratricopeptide repeat-containing sensor histidine kinase [Gracilimonas mengyeensis]|uniref:histidine kinase n=1 Tax=Gracilimonas mengyeensis TaxID=1302730 RepID=A0A521FCW8_9BACT|nr:tetratricopeptide repeat protein [Gracilimonas mengyeensis]SMO94016.1 Signal transduction histidine kinase [Gracilimonas mengyeensis]